MSDYYFDIETYGPGAIPNPATDKIIAAQYQQMDTRTGMSVGDLVILKEWDDGYSEKRIVSEIYAMLFENEWEWNFIPVGFNLWFEWRFLNEKFKKYLGKQLDIVRFCRPQIDLKHVALLMNQGQFKGCSLDAFTKKISGVMIKELYETKRYKEIEKYIELEAKEFLAFYKRALGNLSKLGAEMKFQRAQSG